jgi:hypothetical protein
VMDGAEAGMNDEREEREEEPAVLLARAAKMVGDGRAYDAGKLLQRLELRRCGHRQQRPQQPQPAPRAWRPDFSVGEEGDFGVNAEWEQLKALGRPVARPGESEPAAFSVAGRATGDSVARGEGGAGAGASHTGRLGSGGVVERRKVTLSCGDTYDGEWLRGRRHGQGLYEWARGGGRYEGEWQHSYQQGQGLRVYRNGTEYEGEWRLDNREGQGVRDRLFCVNIRLYARHFGWLFSFVACVNVVRRQQLGRCAAGPTVTATTAAGSTTRSTGQGR